MVIKKNLPIIVLFLIQNFALAQSQRNEASVAVAMNAMRKMQGLQKSPISNWGGEPFASWAHFCNLRDNASDKQLLKLLKDTNAVVKGYSFMVLCGRKNINIYKILLKHLSDNQIISWADTDVGKIEKIGDFFIHEAIKSNRISEIEKKKIQQIFLRNRAINLQYRNIIFKEIETNNKNYVKIKKFVTSENNQNALVALSKYQKQVDKIFIEKSLSEIKNENYGFECIINFPDSTFIPYLKAFHQRQMNINKGLGFHKFRLAYKAVASYKNQFSVDYFQNVLQNSTEEAFPQHCGYIWIATQRFPSKIFVEINKIVEEKGRVEFLPFEFKHFVTME